jgi:hypothetical protein
MIDRELIGWWYRWFLEDDTKVWIEDGVVWMSDSFCDYRETAFEANTDLMPRSFVVEER